MMQDRAGYTENLKTVLLAVVLFLVLLLFGIGMFGRSFGEALELPVVNRTEAKSITLNQFPDARILEIQLDKEDGKHVYEVELVTTEGEKMNCTSMLRPAELRALNRNETLGIKETDGIGFIGRRRSAWSYWWPYS